MLPFKKTLVTLSIFLSALSHAATYNIKCDYCSKDDIKFFSTKINELKSRVASAGLPNDFENVTITFELVKNEEEINGYNTGKYINIMTTRLTPVTRELIWIPLSHELGHYVFEHFSQPKTKLWPLEKTIYQYNKKLASLGAKLLSLRKEMKEARTKIFDTINKYSLDPDFKFKTFRPDPKRKETQPPPLLKTFVCNPTIIGEHCYDVEIYRVSTSEQYKILSTLISEELGTKKKIDEINSYLESDEVKKITDFFLVSSAANEVYADTIAIWNAKDLEALQNSLPGPKGDQKRFRSFNQYYYPNDFYRSHLQKRSDIVMMMMKGKHYKLYYSDPHHALSPVRYYIGQLLLKNEFSDDSLNKALSAIIVCAENAIKNFSVKDIYNPDQYINCIIDKVK